MKCPYCGNNCADGQLYCEVCKQPLPTGEEAHEESAAGDKQHVPRTRWQRALIVLCWIICFVAVGIGVYKLVFWIDSYKITRLYTRGEYTPTLSEVQMEDGRAGHALIFYGEDGDAIYLPELNRSLSICGGVARMEIADSDWFGNDVSEYDYADISFAPVLVHTNGTEIQLPIVKYTINAPESPLEVLSPAENNLNIVTSVYPVSLQVVPGSSVYINGEDLTDSLDRSGLLNVNISVQPIGDNTYTVIVRTPHHKETRHDIVINRQHYDIEIELSESVSTTSSSETMAISGSCEPGAMISVDTAYLEDSLAIDMTTGEFSFIVTFDQLGDNVVRFRATKEGRQDAVISFTVNYKPPLAVYSANAWKMDYDGLRRYFEQWLGHVFKCVGTVIDTVTEDNKTYLIMDVGTNGTQQLVVLVNESTLTPSLGPSYTAYADVAGRYMYQAQYYPLLNARYLDLTASD